MHYIVFDLEATCWDNKFVGVEADQEVIEIGAVKLNEYGELLGDFQSFVKPGIRSGLSNYCVNLTGIRQEQIDIAKSFESVIGNFLHWVEAEGEMPVFCAWGRFDKILLKNECARYNLEDEWIDPYVNIREQYKRLKNLHGRLGLKSAMNMERLEFYGNHHRALDDALNLSQIVRKHIDLWVI